MRRWNKKIYTEYMRERELRNRPSAASHNELKPHKTPETFYENKLFFAHIAIEMRQQGCSIYYSNSSNIRRRPLSLTNRFAEYCQVFFIHIQQSQSVVFSEYYFKRDFPQMAKRVMCLVTTSMRLIYHCSSTFCWIIILKCC